MEELATVVAKLAGVRKAVGDLLSENVSRGRDNGGVLTRTNFSPEMVDHYVNHVSALIGKLKELLPDLFGDLRAASLAPDMQMTAPGPNLPAPMHYSRAQINGLVRLIDQVFEIRANSELAQPAQTAARGCVFVTHGRSQDWRAVQAFIEKDVGLKTIELAQEPNLGRTIIEKLEAGAGGCDSAVIVMTGDDVANDGEVRVRENVMHEIGYFHGRYGRRNVVLLHEEAVNTPTNLAGIAYVPFPKGAIEAGFHVLQRELSALYKS